MVPNAEKILEDLMKKIQKLKKNILQIKNLLMTQELPRLENF